MPVAGVPKSPKWPFPITSRCDLTRIPIDLQCGARSRSTQHASPLDKQKGVRGSRCASEAYRKLPVTHDLTDSMSRSGNPHDCEFTVLPREPDPPYD